MRAPRADPSSGTARRRSFDVTPLTGPPVTLANGDWADLATGVTAYTRPSWRRIWTSPSREASSRTSVRRWRAVEYVCSFIDPAPPRTSLASSRSSGSDHPARGTETQMTEHLPECTHRTRRCPTRDRDPRHIEDRPPALESSPARRLTLTLARLERRTRFSGPGLNTTGRPCTYAPDQPGACSRLKCVERPRGLGHNPGHNHLRLDQESRK
jgi:hypothetical protein